MVRARGPVAQMDRVAVAYSLNVVARDLGLRLSGVRPSRRRTAPSYGRLSLSPPIAASVTLLAQAVQDLDRRQCGLRREHGGHSLAPRLDHARSPHAALTRLPLERSPFHLGLVHDPLRAAVRDPRLRRDPPQLHPCFAKHLNASLAMGPIILLRLPATRFIRVRTVSDAVGPLRGQGARITGKGVVRISGTTPIGGQR